MPVPATNGKILLVDLTTSEIKSEHPADEIYQTYLGGYGLGAYYLYKMQKPQADPLGPDNILGFFTGLLTGTAGITSNRYVVVGKSPKTGGWGDANSGGTFGPAMKTAGLDGILFTGCSDKPVYLLVKGGEAKLLPADELWGLDAVELEDKVQELYGPDARAACIGPSGENVNLLSCIMNDKGRAAGRSGLGAVMGSKKLKAVVVCDGIKEVTPADPDGLKEAIHQHREFLKTQPRYKGMRTYGTCGSAAGLARKGDTPIKNWGGTTEIDFPTVEKISDDNVIAIEKKKYACWRCPLACGGITKVEDGKFACEGHKPEYETLGSFGAMCLNDDLASINLCNDICNRQGMDTISTGGTVAFAIECFENGLLTTEETDGLELRWGNAEAIVELTRRIARREGIGEILADGVRKAAQRIGKGSEQYAIHIGGEEPPMHDPRLVSGVATNYTMDATPARHTQIGTWIFELGAGPPEFMEQPQPQEFYPGKGKLHAKVNNYFHVAQSAGLCMFALLTLKPSFVTDSLTYATGREYTFDDVMEMGARIAALRIAFNHREGVRNVVDYKLPKRLEGDPPLQHGPTAGRTVQIDAQIKDYLEAMGWDPETGVPTRETLKQLGLDFVVDDLHG